MKGLTSTDAEKNRLSGSNSEWSAAPPCQPKKNSVKAKLREGKLKIILRTENSPS